MNGPWKSGAAMLTGFCLLCICAAAVAGDTNDDSKDASKSDSGSFGYQQVVDKAKKLAGKDYKPRDKVPKFLRDMSVADLAKIHFKPGDALWQSKKTPFEIRFYHPGAYFTYPVKVHIVADGKVETQKFSPDQFQYPSDDLRHKIPDDLGYAGVKILHQLNSPKYLDEVASFLGASYFRALPKGGHYGLSARGLAIDTAVNGGEEFPAFTNFWLVKPDAGDQSLTVYALLDSPSATGAYRFIIDPGHITTMEVKATLFTRKAIKKLGIAPLTSMFTWGENSLHRLDNPQPEAHDSDGLLVHNGNGEWLWRPLKNPQALTVNRFETKDVRGFGLLQRDRDFSHYQRLDFQYEKRPSLWVVPGGDWKEGAVELVQIPSDSDINDNIAAYWVPKAPVKADETLHFNYTLKWRLHDPSRHDHGTTRATRIGYVASTPGKKRDQIEVDVEFVGGMLGALTEQENVKPHVSAKRDVKLKDVHVTHNPHTGGWRLTFRVPTSAFGEPLELRAYLSYTDGQPLTETWTYTLKP